MADQSDGGATDVTTSLACNDKDEDLDALLDDALEDFHKPPPPPPPSTKATQESSEPVGDSQHSQDAILESLWDDDALLKMSESWDDVMKEMSTEDPNLMAEFQQFQNNFQTASDKSERAASSEGSTNQSFDDHIAKTLQDLTSNMNDLKVGDDEMPADFSELMKEMQANMSAAGGGDIEGDDTLPNGDSFMSMMHGMMENLLSKDLLYPSLKEIKEKYPSWFAANEGKVKVEEFMKYKQQNEIVCQLCSLFESECDDDTDKVKQERMSKIVELMQKMQVYGQPPPDMMADIAGDQGSEGTFPATPPLPTDCSIM